MQLEQALGVAESDVKDASAGVMQDLKRFQKEKEADLRRYMVSSFPLSNIIARGSQSYHGYRSPMHVVTWIGR